MDEAGAEALSR